MTADLSRIGGLLLVGCGKMGGALLQGWLARGVPAKRIQVVEPALDPARTAVPAGVGTVAHAGDLPSGFAPEIVVFAVKPQVMADVVPGYAGFAGPNTAFVSIAAGTPIRFFEERLGEIAMIRVMPNTPAAVGHGMSVLCANAGASQSQRQMAEGLMAAVGATAWLDDEGLMDAVTAVSGSGPAYVFLLIECLAKAGEAVGLTPDLAKVLALQTVAGAGALAAQSDDDAAQLRVNVTSPGGTTQAALEVLMAADGLQPLLTAAVAAAEKRGRELGS